MSLASVVDCANYEISKSSTFGDRPTTRWSFWLMCDSGNMFRDLTNPHEVVEWCNPFEKVEELSLDACGMTWDEVNVQ